jgi:ADP-ribose pyrophosphatase YjhB (NUDIX family)
VAATSLPAPDADGIRRWTVAAGIIEHDGKVLLVRNLRRNGSLDWSTPGGVVEDGEALTVGLSREVVEETGLSVTDWHGPLYSVETFASAMGWHLRAVVFRASAWDGSISIEDPDGIVVDARFMPIDDCAPALHGTPRWVHEPLLDWLHHRWEEHRQYTYDLLGSGRADMEVVRR